MGEVELKEVDAWNCASDSKDRKTNRLIQTTIVIAIKP